tara:strand:+ start:4732 stop:5523 length:792 start_codon:yes stop_codon:yes gene_type:complete
MKRLMMIGFGAMAEEVLKLLPEGMVLGWVVATERSRDRIARQVGNQVQVITAVAACDGRPDLVLECAGQAGVRAHGAAVLQRGWDLMMISIGALADRQLADQLYAAAAIGNARLHALPGAIAGIDGLAAAREGGLHQVTYTCRKNPQSWRGSPAESMIDLATIKQPQIFFEGTARQAALTFPANANVAATIALASLGLDGIRVQLVVDPFTTTNQHQIEACGRFGEMSIQLCGKPLDNNPKTSTLAALSVVRACRQSVSTLVI